MSEDALSSGLLPVTAGIAVPLAEIEIGAVRSQGAGGQNVNKVSTAVHLRFSVPNSSLPDKVKQRLLALADRRISRDGVIVIKAQTERSLERNRAVALGRLAELIAGASHIPKSRKPTRPTRASQRRRVDEKVKRGRIKGLRGRVDSS